MHDGRVLGVVDDITLQIAPADGWSVVFADHYTHRVEPIICWRLARLTRQWADPPVTGKLDARLVYFRSGKKEVTTEILAVTRETLSFSRIPFMGARDIVIGKERLNVESLPGFVGYFHSSEMDAVADAVAGYRAERPAAQPAAQGRP